MIVVNIKRTYPKVIAGELSLEDATRGVWAKISDQAVAEFGDVIVGVVGDEVVSAYDITGDGREEDGRVYFEVEPSVEFAHLVGQPSPVGPWKSGQARPIKYVDSDLVRHGDAPIVTEGTARRAVIDGYTLLVDQDGRATVIPPLGGSVTVAPPLRAISHPLIYIDDAGIDHAAAIIDQLPMGGYIFIEYLTDGIPAVAAVDGSRVHGE